MKCTCNKEKYCQCKKAEKYNCCDPPALRYNCYVIAQRVLKGSDNIEQNVCPLIELEN
jgi:hypothetical protein